MKTWVHVIYKKLEKKIVFSLSVRKINALSDTANQNQTSGVSQAEITCLAEKCFWPIILSC